MIGGGLMVLIGVLYLAFEDAILGVSTQKYRLSRSIIGVQVGEIVQAEYNLYLLD
jgi:hypothetical protein